jgi:rhamnogalacturonan endolyase
MTMNISRRQMIKGAVASVPVAKIASIAFAAPTTPASTALSGTALVRDDFSKMTPGWLEYPMAVQGPAIQENQWIDSRAHKFGQWANGVADQDAWFSSMEPATGQHYMQQQWWKMPHDVSAVLVSGEDEWADYDYEALVRPLSFDGFAGIAFRYQTNLQYYTFGLFGGNTVQLNVQQLETKKFREPNWTVVASANFEYDTQQYYKLKVENRGSRVTCYLNSKKVLETNDAMYPGGKIGISANTPARFQDVKVDAAADVKTGISSRVHVRNAKLAELQMENPKPRLWKKFSTNGFGAASQVRFGDLNGDGVPEMLLAQNIQTVSKDAFDQLCCLTAVNTDGKILWQSGKPGKNYNNSILTNDNPFQIHDVDGDGKAEVVCIRDFQIQILNGQTGKIKKWCWMPKASPLPAKHGDNVMRPYELMLGDSLFFINVSGNANRQEIFVKDRYTNFYIFSNDLKLLWTGTGQTGHCPYIFDAGNGYDNLMIGYSLWDHTGKQLWSQDKNLKDHADSVAVVNMSVDPNAPPQVYSTGSDEGYLRFDYKDGKITSHQMIGHAQASSIAKYRMDLPGLQLMMIDFHWNPGVVLLYDSEGNILKTGEPIHNGSKLLPVNWRGDGQEFALLSSDPVYGGMVNGNLDRTVMFPNDGHPDLVAVPIDMTGDGRDDVVVWDDKSVWIYTQDRPFKGEKLYSPTRNPFYNFSNYSCIVSKPGWKDVPHVAPAPKLKA